MLDDILQHTVLYVRCYPTTLYFILDYPTTLYFMLHIYDGGLIM